MTGRRQAVLMGVIAGGPTDTTAPTVTGFAATTPASSTTVSITTFTATDAVGVTGYQITESSTPPLAGGAGWGASAPTTFVVSGSTGNYTLYPWAKDAAGNVSSVYGSPVTVVVIVAGLWLDFSVVTGLYQANDTTTPVTADGQTIGYATDKSGAGKHATQGTLGARPLWKANIQNSLGACLFDASDDYLASNNALTGADFTAIVVYKYTALADYASPLSAATNYGNLDAQISGTGICYAGTDIANRIVTGGGYVTTAAQMLSLIKNGTGAVNLSLYKNGANLNQNTGKTAPAPGTAAHRFGKTNTGTTMNGYLFEVIIFTSALADAARQAVEGYLRTKWATP